MNTNPARHLSFCVLGLVLLAPAAPAQDAIEEIIVTARQREETLRDVPGTIVFPAQSAGSALLTIAAGYLLWHERHSRGTLAGAGLAAAGLVLVSI